ncbi:hypothetical protein JWG42_09260 [Desulfoprunum benzoelyticum]|uniref:Uncharacterized protein n=1 Tax=Desulfoprunum benzoelyticum TaxID=1506996 RepID=A0A840UT27_9BACT|nr:hypothetical protein [Desulfoprunum benzoelyticum]MBB5347903.1 hypothetical protein [Desulfoprunum benzoelyticum]MBM9530340.1 hypothetical protein [Desulfoprunum benzoelyticum]
MAPARMISFIEQHVAHCEVCQADPVIHDEIVKITEIILPESKIPKAMRLSADSEEEEDEESDSGEDDLHEDSEAEDEDLEDIEDIDEEPMLDDDEI